MNRNTEQRFSSVPTLEISRSKFNRSFTHKTTFSAASIIPIYCDCTIMPGDTVKMGMSEVVRMMTPICPVMDNCYMDTYFFFVPYRLVWDHFREFMGENTSAPWVQSTEYKIPQIAAPAGGTNGTGWKCGDIADYLGYPTKKTGYKGSALPFRAYGLIYNEFFRDENLQYPQDIVTSRDSDTAGQQGGSTAETNNPLTQARCGGTPLKACKYHDYFTSCLPAPQKGPSITVPLETGKLPVRVGSKLTSGEWKDTDSRTGKIFGTYNYRDTDDDTLHMYGITTTDSGIGSSLVDSGGMGETQFRLYTDMSDAVGATINQLRQAFAIQKFYERQARGGTRYIEMVKSHFNVTNPDYRLQRPEYLGGKRIPINMNQVVQNAPYVEYSDDQSEIVGTTPMGATGAYSVTSDTNHDLFTHSFTEHGILMGLAVIRTDHTYQQGLNRQYSMKSMLDFYFPEFANLGEQAVLNKEIYLQGSNNAADEEAFGYQEAYAHYRYIPDIVTGEMRSNYDSSLDIWHYADYYTDKPTLSDGWIQETDANIERTLAVQNHDQFIADFYFNAVYTRPMPLYSIPGLIDHH